MDTKEQEEKMGTIVKILVPYLTVYPACKLNRSGLYLYARALSDIPADEIDAAMTKLMRTENYFPSVAKILETVKSTRDFLSDKDATDAGSAWQEAMKLVKDIGIYGHWTFSSPAVERAVRNFGKMELCNLKTDELNS